MEYISQTERSLGLDVHVLFELNHGLVGYGRVRWFGHVLRREDGHVLRSALDI